MATATIKTTYSLDLETVRQLEELARHWSLSKSAALRRAIGQAASTALPQVNKELEALDNLQRSLALDMKKARAWEDQVRRERHAAAARNHS